jgi:hypothetical protein
VHGASDGNADSSAAGVALRQTVPAYPGHSNLADVLQLLESFSASLASASRFGLELILGAFGSSLGVNQKPQRYLYE